MKLVNYDEFIRMPAGTIFAPYARGELKEELSIKTSHGRTYQGKWVFCGIMPLTPWNIDEVLFGDESVRASFEAYDGDEIDCADYDKFLVLEDFDIERLISVLQWAKNGCPEEHESFDEW